MIDIDRRSSKQQTQKIFYPKYTDSVLSKIETTSFKSSIYSNDHFDTSSSSNTTIEYRQRNQLSNLYSLDFIQSSASFIYPNIRTISSGYINKKKINSIYLFQNKSILNKNIPLIFLGSEYFLRKIIDFENFKYPLSTNEHLEPLIDLFLNRPQFIKEIPQLDNLSDYRLLPESISGLVFFDSIFNSSLRHLCTQLNQNKFSIKDLLNMSQRENNIIQQNAVNDKRYQNLLNELNEIYFYQLKL